MINISELRIGNILHADEADKTLVATVRAIDENKISFYECTAVSPSQVRAVGLSELWLDGYSFSYSEEQMCWTKGNLVLKKSQEGFVFSLGHHTQTLLHVHQLQNVYYILFDESLEIQMAQDTLREDIEIAADSIMVNYLPKDKQAGSFSFTLSIEGDDYDVHYQKDLQGYWYFSSYTTVSHD